MNEYLKVTGLCKTFQAGRSRGKVEAVQNVSLVLNPGDSLGIIGPSGCGKTTLTRMLLGLLKPDSGRIEITDRLGFVPQDPYSSLDPSMTVYQLVGEPLRFTHAVRSWRGCAAQVRHTLSYVNLDYEIYKDRFPAALSGGERQRVAIARALVLEPQLLILDEPTSMLDEKTKSEITALLAHLAEQHNRAFLMVTHDIAMSAAVCRRLIVMEAGTIIEEGTSEQIRSAPKTELARRLVLAATDLRAYWEQQAL